MLNYLASAIPGTDWVISVEEVFERAFDGSASGNWTALVGAREAQGLKRR